MTNLLVAIALAVVTFTMLLLRKVYRAVPARELKRRARRGSKQARVLYRAVAFGVSLTVFLWLLIGVSATALCFVVAREFSWPIALLGITVLLVLGVGLTKTRVSKTGRQLVAWLTPAIAWLLNILHPVLEPVGMFFRKYAAVADHTQLYQKDDLVELLQHQEQQADNRVAKSELEMAIHALTFGDKLVSDVCTPYSQVQVVNAQDSFGPILMDELHKSGYSRFPVFDGKKTNVIGVLYLHDLLQEAQGDKVQTLMNKHVTYLHEDQTLFDALQVFLKTKRHLAIAVNEFEEMVGVITIEDVLEQIIGKPIVDEFDQYDDLRAVAKRTAAQTHKEQRHDSPPIKPHRK